MRKIKRYLCYCRMKEEILKKSKESGKEIILEADFNSLANHVFHRISEEVIKEYGLPWEKYVFPEWKKWLDKEVREG